ncbi:MAG: hypothetical protein HQL75_03940 [Magnetococcales bacterium]|nr:hypothetical protein [Magnetococcales bacterium]
MLNRDDPETQNVLICADVEARAIAAEKKCFGALNKLANSNKDWLYTFKHRRKSRKKIRNKAENHKKNSDDEFDPYKITDAWACRYVLLSQEFMAEFVEKLVRLIATEEDVDGISSPFKHGGLEKITIYDNRPDSDPLAITEKVKGKILKFLPSEHHKVVKGSKESGYSSVHIIAMVTVDYETLSGNLKKGVDVPVELQIRDVFEDAWGEIEHRMVYSSKDDEEGRVRSISANPLWRQHLGVLKVFVDGCSQYAGILHRYELQSRITEEPKSDSAPISRADADKGYVISLLQKEGVGREVISVVDGAYKQLKKVQDQRLQLSDPAYQELADKFADAIKISKDFLDRKFPDGYAIRYFLESERLLAMMNTTDGELQPNVQDDYQELFKQFPEDVVLSYRKGQILCRDSELESFYEAVAVLEKAQANIDNPQCFPSNFEPKWLGFLRDAIPVQLGHAYGRIYECLAKTDPEKAKEYLGRGIQLNQGVVDRCNLEMFSQVEPDHCRVLGRAVNNFLTCLLDKECGSGTIAALILSKQPPDWNKERVIELLQWMVDSPALAKFRTEFTTRDTVMVVRAVLGETKLAIQEAVAILDELYKRALRYTSMESLSPGQIPEKLKGYDEKLCYVRATTIHALLS